ncbi:MAG: FkbM family methyltransferase, partial [Coriobacteriia bacterium]|nr:FkbM family methyltransferase [Coriobacteriia bacterium]
MTVKRWLYERFMGMRLQVRRLVPPLVFHGDDGSRYLAERSNALDRELQRTHGQLDAGIDWCRAQLNSDMIAVDVGANAGYWSLPLARVSRVIAFEPDAAMRRKLAGNVALNPEIEARIHVRHEAVSVETGE